MRFVAVAETNGTLNVPDGFAVDAPAETIGAVTVSIPTRMLNEVTIDSRFINEFMFLPWLIFDQSLVPFGPEARIHIYVHGKQT
jgi:hypothetical protein